MLELKNKEYDDRSCLEYTDCIGIEFSGREYKIWISLCETQVFKEYVIIDNILHQNEKIIYNNLHYERRINSFLLGRYAAKRAISKLIGEKDLSKIGIVNGVFSQPIVECETGKSSQVSISHCNDFGFAVAFPEFFLLGIDVEEIDPKKSSLIENELTQKEKELAYSFPFSYDCFLTSVWTIKESLSKVLKTGLTVPLSLLEIKNIEFKDNSFISIFSNFIQYCTVSIIIGNYVCSLTYPRNVELNICTIRKKLCSLFFYFDNKGL